MPILGQFPAFRCGRGTNCLFCFPVAVDIEADLVFKVLVPDVIILVTFDVVERGVREMCQQASDLLDQFLLRV